LGLYCETKQIHTGSISAAIRLADHQTHEPHVPGTFAKSRFNSTFKLN